LPEIPESWLRRTNQKNEKAAHRAAFVHLLGEIASVDFFDHPALARVDQISPVFAMDIPVFTK
jgi:hypothetical protein